MGDVFMNVRIEDHDAKMLERMMTEDFIDNRSMFIRKLIRQEWARRYSQPNPAISVADAMLASEEVKKGE
jgi:metal-responsive CopG/Arc/MetJ family transcriptional regulator